MDQPQKDSSVTLAQAIRRSNLLVAAAEVSRNITQILDIDVLLPKTVDIICDAYDFYYSGVFLVDQAGEYAVLKAGRGEPGRIMMENNHKLAVGGNSMIGACTALNEARISLDVDTEKVWYPNPVLPETRSEMALPLAIGERVIGAVTVQSVEAAAFSDEDISSLQAMANQLAIAIDNARKRRELEQTHQELLRAKTFEAIATATGDAIHWIGNKAEPIGGSVERIRHDVKVLMVAAANALSNGNETPAQLIQLEGAAIIQDNPDIKTEVEKLAEMPAEKVQKRYGVSSILEDLEIIEDAARLIIRVKEDMIGPAREQAPRPTMLDDVVKDAVNSVDIPREIVSIEATGSLPLGLADPVQLNRVFVNLLNNAYEAMGNQKQPDITLTLETNPDNSAINVVVTDNGSGIDPELLDKIWITFHTTKGIKGHPGLGLPACRLILEQIGGDIAVDSTPGKGTTFIVGVPVYTGKAEQIEREQKQKARILLIDDNDGWRSFASGTLAMTGYKVAVSGESYHFDTPDQYDLIIVDDILTDADSTESLNVLKTSGVIGKTLVVSSNPRVERTKERMLLGVKNLIAKPYTQASLLSEVTRALNSN